MQTEERRAANFIEEFINEDLASGRYDHVHTRFPPEPNGYMHIGHCKALIMDFLTAEKYGGKCNLRFDDTNPAKEDTEYVEAIKRDIHWLGFDWTGGLYYASDYYDKCYEIAEDWIKRDLAYVDELNKDEMREYRGTLTKPGKNSPWRDRPWEESLDLFRRMRNGEFPEGSYTLRAKIDMASPNIVMRDPALYRILYKEHWRTGKKWCIYPMYDFAHPIGDALEGISHSLCSLEYEIHRPLYDWVVEHSQHMLPARPRQIEFARLNMTQTVMSKRKLRALVEGGHVRGWDDPRMPTLSALRRRGYSAAAIRDFVSRIGLSKADSTVDYALLEACVRDDLGSNSLRAMAVLNPIKVVLTNWPEGEVKKLTMENHPDHPEMGTHEINFCREIYIDAEDFMEVPAKKFQRMYPGFEVRLKGAYIVKCEGCTKDEEGNVIEIQCTVDFDSASGQPGSERKIKGKVLHWVSAIDAVPFEARLYEPLLTDEEEQAEEAAEPVVEDIVEEAAEDAEASEDTLTRKDYDFLKQLNPNSLTIVNGVVEPCVLDAEVGTTYQFLRVGYFCKDPDSTAEKPVFNRTVGLRDSFTKQVKK
ncbi:MAG: glutamine--tRNA ligase/YqeY domain fusion protein [Clostridia bacterium]|nr:glutamine--tRNA ligase/YqeY domain fusion protein [Clostridia bacterium]